MNTTQIQKVPARKALRAIEYHLANPAFTRETMVTMVHRELTDFVLAVHPHGKHYNKIVHACHAAIDACDIEEVLAGIALLRMSLPPETYGEITTGTSFTYEGFRLVKRKGGVEFDGAEGVLWLHLQADTIVIKS